MSEVQELSLVGLRREGGGREGEREGGREGWIGRWEGEVDGREGRVERRR